MKKFLNTIKSNFPNHEDKDTRAYLEATSLYADNNVHLLTGVTNAKLYLWLDDAGHQPGVGSLSGFQIEIAQTVICNLLTVLNTIFVKLNYRMRGQTPTGKLGEIHDCELSVIHSMDYFVLSFMQVVPGDHLRCSIKIGDWLDSLTADDISKIMDMGVNWILTTDKNPPAVFFDKIKTTPTNYKEVYLTIKRWWN